jgi:HK97 family phage major capsid protein
MVDSNGHPIARINYGINGKPERVVLGREVVISENASATKAFIFDFADYILNTVYDLGIQKKQDWDTEDMLTKAVMSVDGKVANKDSLVTMTLA